MKPDALTVLSVAALLGAAWGVSVGPVGLINNQSYISFDHKPSPNTSVILCPYQLAAGEEVQRVYWEMWDDTNQVGTYEWRPATGGLAATGRLEGVVELNRDDGELELTKLRHDLAGDYLCGVELTNGQSKTSSKEQVLIVETSGLSFFGSSFGKCSTINSYTTPAIYPEPTMRAGLYLEESETFYKEVSSKDWMKVMHPNGSFTYSLNKAIFKKNKNTPRDITFKVETGFTKSDGTYISLTYAINYMPFQDCPDVKERDHNNKAVVTDCPDVKERDHNNKAVVSTGSPSLALLFASVFGVVLLFGPNRP